MEQSWNQLSSGIKGEDSQVAKIERRFTKSEVEIFWVYRQVYDTGCECSESVETVWRKDLILKSDWEGTYYISKEVLGYSCSHKGVL